MNKNVLAFDLGASSGRVILGSYNKGVIEIKELHRFSNGVIEKDGKLFWDIEYLFKEILNGLEKATSQYKIDSVAFDTWGVDIACFDQDGKLLQAPVSYRDKRTQGMTDFVEKHYLSLKELFRETGNYPMAINTLFQLVAFREQQEELFKQTHNILSIPDMFNYFLTGIMKSERSIASTMQMMNPHSKNWNEKLMKQVGLSPSILPELVSEGNILGEIKQAFTTQKIKVINVCAHDTASAVVSVPTVEESFLFISSGTWSLLGTEMSHAENSDMAYASELSNELGAGGSTQFLKNCTGLWIIQELRKEFLNQGFTFDFKQIAALAEKAQPFRTLIDTESPCFASPGGMIEKIQNYSKMTNQYIPVTPGEFFRCVYESLALHYQEVVKNIQAVTNETHDVIYIIGGGSQAAILCQMVSNATGKKVCAGPAEATALGNIAIQLKALGVFKDMYAIRSWVRAHQELKFYKPEDSENWKDICENYKTICKNKEV